MTKCDKLNMSMRSKIYKNLKNKLNFEPEKYPPLLVSINDKKSILRLKEMIEGVVREAN